MERLSDPAKWMTNYNRLMGMIATGHRNQTERHTAIMLTKLILNLIFEAANVNFVA